jgi:predicted dehydrogenase/glycosyltransferase involved in cell wall biosynthesis
MRICIDASNISRGGGLTHLVQLLRHDLPDLGIECVFVWASSATLAAIEDRPWLIKRTEATLERNFLRRALWQRNRLGPLARADRCDVLFVPGGTFATSFRPVVTMSRNLLPFELQELFRYGLSALTLKFLVLRWTQSRAMRVADGTIFLTHYARDAVTARIGPLPGQTVLVPHGADASFRAPLQRFRHLSECSTDQPFRVVYVSIIDVYKHQDHVAQAVADLRDRGYPIQLNLVGPSYPPALDRLKKLLARIDPQGITIRLVGPKRYEELPAVYAEADLAVFASSCENMPNILLEMMAAGLPIACSNRGPMPEILGAGEYFDPEHPRDIAAAIERLMLSPERRQQSAMRAQARTILFSWQRCTTDTFTFLNAVVKRHRQFSRRASPAPAIATVKATHSSYGRLASVRKVVRFIAVYGLGRTFFKVAGRLRLRVPVWRPTRVQPDIGLIGCGQFAFATIGYFITRRFGRRVLACHDINPQAAATLANGLGVRTVTASADELLTLPNLRCVYIASNHASHTPYAVQALARGLDVYVEKPVSVTLEQLGDLRSARAGSHGRLFAGYNRPFSAAVRVLRGGMPIDPAEGITLQCTVVGHLLAPDHWYRLPEEGTRICGNVGHWLDLFVHILAWRGLPTWLGVTLSWADESEPDENLCIALTSNRGDLCSIVLTARAEPFEGINETIVVQHGSTLCKIDDFRRMTLWCGPRVHRRRFWPKDPGHRGAIMQPFDDQYRRSWEEVENSSLLMLHITEMVRSGNRQSTFDFASARACLDNFQPVDLNSK